ncbi:sulfonate transport system substrate-binding protein [Pseudomonas protegens]|mgnify:FL=1|uniref:ABC transporter substrate-binding protein n=1 Tax=Pseudomonas TaxID=286 RepID=UPI000F4746AA|nr:MULTISPECIES: ABC transporter substrate-binding protein [Pseudomonas]MCS4260878.1 sulfonate transport system substrate-binding protein [Pseudomonas sp. BIGb0176]MDF4207777.1 ABC transporter substrate-binding protein [Pseudomonas protegens]MDK1397194.1 ABC transporter substrate-binding protein [Pseudomonas protegens]ROQ61558.1 sulfonate transport system substrate-binding protein [Pseudomonas protegens]ROQ83878.1 sulfonate transport system substrate-binding protein [Pseudomonas protegens]
MQRRHFLQLSALAGLAAALPRLGLGLGASVDLSGVTLNVATYKGAAPSFFAEAGIEPPPYKVKYAEFTGGNLSFEALVSGTLDISPMSEIPPIFGIKNHAPVKLIAVLTGDVNNQAFIVPKGSAVQSVAELKGKRIGYIRSTSSHYFLLKALKEQGLGFADIVPMALTAQDGFAAFQNGALDAWVSFGYFIQLAELRAGARVLKTGQGYLSGNYVIAANQQSIADPAKHAAITDYILREYRSWQWIASHPEEWATRSAQILGMPREVFLAQYRAQSGPRLLQPVDDAAVKSQQDVADLFFEAGVLPQQLDVSGLWDRSFHWT